MTPHFHLAIESARKLAGLTYEGWAETSQSTPSYLFRICRGQAKPERDMVIRLCVGLGLAPDQLSMYLRLAGHLGLSDSRRDNFIRVTIGYQLTVLQIHALLVVAGFPGLLALSRHPAHRESSGQSAAQSPAAQNHPATYG